MGAHDRGVEHLNQMRALAQPREGFEKRFEHARLAQPPEALPNTVPSAELSRQCAPGNVVHGEIMQGFEKLTIISPLIAAPRAHRREHPQHKRPFLFGHPRQHRRSSVGRPAMSHRFTDLGIPPRSTWANPSTRPNPEASRERLWPCPPRRGPNPTLSTPTKPSALASL